MLAHPFFDLFGQHPAYSRQGFSVPLHFDPKANTFRHNQTRLKELMRRFSLLNPLRLSGSLGFALTRLTSQMLYRNMLIFQ